MLSPCVGGRRSRSNLWIGRGGSLTLDDVFCTRRPTWMETLEQWNHHGQPGNTRVLTSVRTNANWTRRGTDRCQEVVEKNSQSCVRSRPQPCSDCQSPNLCGRLKRVSQIRWCGPWDSGFVQIFKSPKTHTFNQTNLLLVREDDENSLVKFGGG